MKLVKLLILVEARFQTMDGLILTGIAGVFSVLTGLSLSL